MISFVALAKSPDDDLNTCPKPTGTADNDIMLAHVWAYEETVTSAPAGWTQFESWQTADVIGEPEIFNSYFFVKEAGASEPADYTWETTTTTGPTPNRRVVIATYRGVDLTDPIAEERTTHTEGAASNTLELHNMTTGAPGRRAVFLGAVGTDGVNGSLPSPWVERLDEDGQFVYDRRIVVSGNTGISTLTLTAVITSFGIAVMLPAAPEQPGFRNYCQSVDTQIN